MPHARGSPELLRSAQLRSSQWSRCILFQVLQDSDALRIQVVQGAVERARNLHRLEPNDRIVCRIRETQCSRARLEIEISKERGCRQKIGIVTLLAINAGDLHVEDDRQEIESSD